MTELEYLKKQLRLMSECHRTGCHEPCVNYWCGLRMKSEGTEHYFPMDVRLCAEHHKEVAWDYERFGWSKPLKADSADA